MGVLYQLSYSSMGISTTKIDREPIFVNQILKELKAIIKCTRKSPTCLLNKYLKPLSSIKWVASTVKHKV